MQSHVQQEKHLQGGKSSGGWWSETTLGMLYVVDGQVQFSDDFDHWKNGFCRLLEIPDEQGRKLIETAVALGKTKHGKLFTELSDEQRLDCAKEAVTQCFYGGARPAKPALQQSWGNDLEGAQADTVYANTISGNKTRIVVGNSKNEFAWLADPQTNKAVSADSIVYDTSYYSSGNDAHYGPKHYMAQADWRLEKAARLARTVLDHSGGRNQSWLKDPAQVKVLDVGAGIGYMRKGFADYGFSHYGTELSEQIIAAAKERFDYDTWTGGVYSVPEFAKGMKFNVIALWDVIEHLGDPADACRLLSEFLTPDGILVVRTPNLMAMENDLLGDYYYSFKLDHIYYFSPASMNKMMGKLGLEPVYVETVSHLFKGLLGVNCLFNIGQQMRGADILGIYGRKR
jgi:2-polyprenyl-3-methyl-5-hydroxy-6-metoxy-1,4-benzoquinol methylase